jgi:autotransporter-associated beta strand protein/probable HAF family extracellular repeat protein
LIFNFRDRWRLTAAEVGQSVNRVALALLCAAVLTTVCARHASAQIQAIDLLGVSGAASAPGISSDGSTVVSDIFYGVSGRVEAARWVNGTTTGLGFLDASNPQRLSFATAASADGSVIVGQSTNAANSGQAFRWSGGVMIGLSGGIATGVSADGNVIVGDTLDVFGQSQAFRWVGGTMSGLAPLNVLGFSHASGVSADGSITVGGSGLSTTEAVEWVGSTVTGLGFLDPGNPNRSSSALAISANGTAIVGLSLNSENRQEATLWAGGKIMGLGFLAPSFPNRSSQANAVSSDGAVIVGSSTTSSGTDAAFRWTSNLGMQPIQGILAAGGFDVSGFQLDNATGVSGDGTVIVGAGWIAHIPVNAFALFDLAGADHTIGSLVWGGIVTNSGPTPATLTVGSDNSSATFIGTIQDGTSPTALTKVGTGNQTLSGNNTYTGVTTINGGTLSVNGSIASSSMTTVNAGGTLGGNGIVGNTTVNGGTLSPGNSIGLLTVQGSLVLTAASSYMVEVSPSAADRTNVAGTATLGGATVNASFTAGAYVAKQYTIVNATGGVSGTFNSLANTNLPTNFVSSLSYDTNNAYLNLALDYGALPSLNQQHVANALTGFFNTTGGIPGVFALLTPAGLAQLSGETAVGSQQTTFNAMTQFITLLLDPFIDGRGNIPASATSAMPFAEQGDDANAYASAGRKRTAAEREAYAAIYRKASKRDSYDPRWSVWAAGFGGSQTSDGNVALGSNNTTSRVFGMAAGADYIFSPRTIAGFALAGGGTSFNVANAGSGRSDLFQAGAFVRHTVGSAYISGALAYGWQDITTDRTVTIAGVDRLRAQFNASAFSGRVEGGYRFVTPWMGGVGVTPYAAGQFTTFDLPAYAEQVVSGANTFALGYAAKDVTATRSELGIRTDKSFAMQNAILTLRGRFAWAHDYNNDRNIGATFQTLPGASFVVGGAAQASDSALATASAEVKWRNGFSLAGTFEGEFSGTTTSYAGKGVARYAW